MTYRSTPIQIITFFILLFLFAFGYREEKKVVVACVGDSITFGARVENPATDSYPAQLQLLLGERFQVVNLGVSSCTLIRKGIPSVWDQLAKIRETNPDLVIISLGTNDTCGYGTCGDRKCWEYKNEFKNDYLDLIDTLRALPSGPKIWLCTPSPMVLETPGLSPEREEGLAIRKPRLQTLTEQIRMIAEDKTTGLIELNIPLDHRPELFTAEDGVHPNKAGYRAIAEIVHRMLDV